MRWRLAGDAAGSAIRFVGIRIALRTPMTSRMAGWMAPDVDLEYAVMQTELGWMLVLRDGLVTLTQVFDSAPAAEAEAQAIALFLAPVDSRPH